jgi:hypothetical protein
MTINNTFDLGELVYLITDDEQHQRLVIGIVVCIDGGILYDLSCGLTNSKHYPQEISRDKRY